MLNGGLVISENATGIVIFSQGSSSTRNRMVTELLQKQNIGTLLLDLLTEEEYQVYANRLNIDLLVSRLIETTDWLIGYNEVKGLPIGYFGVGTGAASALRAATYFGNTIKAVVSRGGRPDLALGTLHQVTAPTVLLIGSLDVAVIEMNKMAYDELQSVKEMKIVFGASHLFEEPGKLLEVADLAITWYKRHLALEKM